MAKKITTTLVDDINGKDATETISFALDGRDYTIDLDESNAFTLRSGLQKFIAVATVVKPAAKSAGKRSGSDATSDAAAIREWAQSQGIEVSQRGRVSDSVRSSYYAGHAKA